MEKKSILSLFKDLTGKKGYPMKKRSSLLVNYPDNPDSLYNYSGAHVHLVPALLNKKPVKKDKIAIIDQCLREADGNIIGTSPSHLLEFTMGVFGGYGRILNRGKEKEFHYKNMLVFLDACGIDRDELVFSICAGGKFLNQEIEADKESFEILNSLGVKPEHISERKGQTNFMLGQGMVTQGMSRPSGCIVEVYKKHKGELIEIASSNIYEYLGKEGKLNKTVNKAVGIGVGMERLDYVTQNLDSVYNLAFYENMKEGISKLLGMNDLTTLMCLDKIYKLSELGKSITIAVNDGQEFNNTKRGKILKGYLAKMVSELVYLRIDHEKFLEILKSEIANKYADPLYGVEVNDKAYDVLRDTLKTKIDDNPKYKNHCMEV